MMKPITLGFCSFDAKECKTFFPSSAFKSSHVYRVIHNLAETWILIPHHMKIYSRTFIHVQSQADITHLYQIQITKNKVDEWKYY